MYSICELILCPVLRLLSLGWIETRLYFVISIKNTKVPVDVILVSMDVTSLYTNIPQEEGIDTVCREYEIFYRNEPPIPKQLLKWALRLILQENSFQFNGKHYLQTHGTAMGTKMAVAFSNIFMNKVETEILSQSLFKPLIWKCYIDDIFSLWTTNRDRIEHFIEQTNNHHSTIKFTAEISDKETFLDTYIYKEERFETNRDISSVYPFCFLSPARS